MILSDVHVEDEEIDDGEETSVEDDEPINPLVNALFDEVEELRMQLYDAHLRCALIEAETREEVMVEMEERMRSMEDMFTRRLMRVVRSFLLVCSRLWITLTIYQMEHNEEKLDAKLDMIQRSRLLSRVAVPRSEGGYSDSIADSIDSDAVGPLQMDDYGEGEFDDVASSIAGVSPTAPMTSVPFADFVSTQRDGDYESNDSDAYVQSTSDARSRTPSPLAHKGRPVPHRQSTIRPDPRPSYDRTVFHKDEVTDLQTETESEDDEASEESEDESDEDEIEDWTESEASETTPARPSAKGKGKATVKTTPPAASKSKPLNAAQAKRTQAQHPQAGRGQRSTRSTSKIVAELEQELDELSLGDDDDQDPEDSTVIIPNRKAREGAADYVPCKGEVDPQAGKKKKRSVPTHCQRPACRTEGPLCRNLGKNRVLTEEEDGNSAAGGSQDTNNGRQLRRSTRGNR